MKNDILQRLLEGLKTVGVEKGERNKTVAEKTGYSLRSVGSILSGHAVLSPRFIQAICTTYGIRKAWVEAGEEPITEEETVSRSEYEALRARGFEHLNSPFLHDKIASMVYNEKGEFRDYIADGLRDLATIVVIEELQKMPEPVRWTVVGKLKEMNAEVEKGKGA